MIERLGKAAMIKSWTTMAPTSYLMMRAPSSYLAMNSEIRSTVASADRLDGSTVTGILNVPAARRLGALALCSVIHESLYRNSGCVKVAATNPAHVLIRVTVRILS